MDPHSRFHFVKFSRNNAKKSKISLIGKNHLKHRSTKFRLSDYCQTADVIKHKISMENLRESSLLVLSVYVLTRLDEIGSQYLKDRLILLERSLYRFFLCFWSGQLLGTAISRATTEGKQIGRSTNRSGTSEIEIPSTVCYSDRLIFQWNKSKYRCSRRTKNLLKCISTMSIFVTSTQTFRLVFQFY